MNRKERRAEAARQRKTGGQDTITDARQAGAAREKILKENMKTILEVYSEMSVKYPGEPFVVVVADTDTDFLALELLQQQRKTPAGFYFLAARPTDLLKLRKTFAEGIGEALEAAKANSLNVLIMAYQGAAAATVFLGSDGLFTLRPMGTEPDREQGGNAAN